MPPENPEHARWFLEEIQPHETKLRNWLKLRFPTLSDVDDLIQETYARLFRSNKAGQLRNPQPYLYATARNMAVDQIRRQQVASFNSLETHLPPDVLDDAPDASARLRHEEDLQLLADAIESLPEKCRLVVKLRKFRSLSYQEIGQKLGISERTVNVHLATGMARVRAYLRDRGLE